MIAPETRTRKQRSCRISVAAALLRVGRREQWGPAFNMPVPTTMIDASGANL